MIPATKRIRSAKDHLQMTFKITDDFLGRFLDVGGLNVDPVDEQVVVADIDGYGTGCQGNGIGQKPSGRGHSASGFLPARSRDLSGAWGLKTRSATSILDLTTAARKIMRYTKDASIFFGTRLISPYTFEPGRGLSARISASIRPAVSSCPVTGRVNNNHSTTTEIARTMRVPVPSHAASLAGVMVN